MHKIYSHNTNRFCLVSTLYQNDKILDWTKSKVFADDKLCVALTLYHTIPTFNDPDKEALKNIVGKGENAGNQHFLLFPQSFLPFPKEISVFESHSICRLQMLSILTSPQFCCLVKS